MTRYARAKGSKSSNERLPEQATSWQEMQHQMMQKSIQSNNTAKEYPSEIRTNFVQDKNTEWAEFPVNNKKRKKEVDNVKLGKKPKLNKHATETIPEQNNATEVSEVDKKKKKSKKDKTTKNVQFSESKVEEVNEEDGNYNLVDKIDKKTKKKSKKDKTTKNVQFSESKVEEVNEEYGNYNLVDSPQKNKKKKTNKEPELTEVVEENFDNNQKHRKSNNYIPKTDQIQHENFTKNQKKPKKFTNTGKGKMGNEFQEFKRRKPIPQTNKVFINGNEIEIAYYDGFPIRKSDADHLKQLKKDMISRGVPRSEVEKTMKLERRKAEKAFAREKKKVCFNCRQSGHILSECPSLREGANAQMSETGICFKCGSTEHTHFECKVIRGENFKFAQCFICKEQGHISRQCPDNNRGLYPKGGACKVCGDVTHLKKDCPKYQMEQQDNKMVAHTIDNKDIESLDEKAVMTVKTSIKSQKVVKF